MFIKAEPLQHWIDHFYGYGSWKAKVWFIAHEDGGGDLPEEVAEKLDYFSAHFTAAEATLCDLREMYRHSSLWREGPKGTQFKNFHDYRFGPKAVLSGVWKNLITFAHTCQGHEPPDDILQYQRNKFARTNEALIKLYPLPSPNNHAWYYSWLDFPQFPFLKSREQYQAHVLPARLQSIVRNINLYKPRLVLMYGMENINVLKNSIQDHFPGLKFRSVQAVRMRIPPYHRAEINGTVILITTQIPALRHNRVETGFDWAAFGEAVKTTGTSDGSEGNSRPT